MDGALLLYLFILFFLLGRGGGGNAKVMQREGPRGSDLFSKNVNQTFCIIL